MDHAQHIDVEDFTERDGVLGVFRQRAAGNPGIRDDDVGGAKTGDEIGGRASERFRVADVSGPGRGMPGRDQGDQCVEFASPASEESDIGPLRRVMPRQRGAAAAARAGDEDVQLFGRSARALTISASITGSIAASDPTFSVETTNLPSMTMSGTDCTP